jgi:hypothetical protein
MAESDPQQFLTQSSQRAQSSSYFASVNRPLCLCVFVVETLRLVSVFSFSAFQPLPAQSFLTQSPPRRKGET